MRIIFSLLILTLFTSVACNQPSQSRLNGAWQADRDRTLEEVAKMEGLDEQVQAMLATTEFFGKSIHVYQNGVLVVSVNEGLCTSFAAAFSDVQQDRNSMKAQLGEAATGTEAEFFEAKIVSGELHSSIPGFKQATGVEGKEIFLRVSLDDVKKNYPCVEEHLE
ncbi:MAG: hypothetical protein JRC77_04930 [Deltaproteobacteria bacterium]|nr:hypothetical protein [Deltaproteobacteria bacterium]